MRVLMTCQAMLNPQAHKGAALLEFALVAPVLILLIFGIADISKIYLERTNITNAARAAGRFAAVLGDNDNFNATCESYKTAYVDKFLRLAGPKTNEPSVDFFCNKMESKPTNFLRARIRTPLGCLFCSSVFKWIE